MTILPIRSITDIDQPIFGTNLVNFGKLARNGFLVPEGVVVTPPEIVINTVLKHFQNQEKQIFEQKLTIVKNELEKTTIPLELEKLLDKRPIFYLNGQFFKKDSDLWRKLLEVWLDQIKAKIWRSGFVEGIASHLSCQTIFFIQKVDNYVETHFDPDLGDVVVKSEKKLDPKFLQKIDQLVIEANKKLFLPQIYKFLIIDGKVMITGLTPFTQTLPASKTEDIVIPKDEQKKIIKSAVKLFVNLSSGFAVDNNLGGVLIEGEKMPDFESMVFRLSDAALNYIDKPIIFKLPDKRDEEIRGALRLVNHKDLLDTAAEALLFVRNKKNLLNVCVAVPFVRSLDEFLQIKRELAVREISRKGTLRLWMEVSVPENVINIEEYVESGIDGIILNIDELQGFLGGFINRGETYENYAYKKQVTALIKFLKPSFKVLHNARVPILVKGELSLHHDVLDALMGEGIYGIVANNPIEADSLPDHLNWAERRMVIKRLSN